MANLFWLAADATHVASAVLLVLKLLRRDARGLSRTTMDLYALVYIARFLPCFCWYLDYYGQDTYSVLLHSFLLGAGVVSALALKLCRGLRATCPVSLDSLRPDFLLLSAFILALFLNNASMTPGSSPLDAVPVQVLWTFSVYLEALAILPQLVLLLQLPDGPDSLTWAFIVLRGAYKPFMLLQWMLENLTHTAYRSHDIEFVAGAIQVLIFYDYVCLDGAMLKAVQRWKPRGWRGSAAHTSPAFEDGLLSNAGLLPLAAWPGVACHDDKQPGFCTQLPGGGANGRSMADMESAASTRGVWMLQEVVIPEPTSLGNNHQYYCM